MTNFNEAERRIFKTRNYSFFLRTNKPSYTWIAVTRSVVITGNEVVSQRGKEFRFQ